MPEYAELHELRPDFPVNSEDALRRMVVDRSLADLLCGALSEAAALRRG